jgi:FkbM family methyltransferase
MKQYYSQIGQDQYYIENISKAKRNGVFLDIGANNGIFESNTAALEFDYGWTGICIEANPELVPELTHNRPNSLIVNCAVWKENCELEFETTNSTHKGIEGHLLSRISNLERNQKYFTKHFEEDRQTFKIQGKTVTNIIAEKFKLPCVIDYASIDTEGAELEALQGIDFSLIDIKFLTIEHGNRQNYIESFNKYLTPYGYVIHRINQWDVEFKK